MNGDAGRGAGDGGRAASAGDGERAASPAAQRRLDEHLELLRPDERQRPDRELVLRTVRRARVQQLIRAPLRVAGMIAAAVFDGVAALLGGRRTR